MYRYRPYETVSSAKNTREREEKLRLPRNCTVCKNPGHTSKRCPVAEYLGYPVSLNDRREGRLKDWTQTNFSLESSAYGAPYDKGGQGALVNTGRALANSDHMEIIGANRESQQLLARGICGKQNYRAQDL